MAFVLQPGSLYAMQKQRELLLSLAKLAEKHPTND